MKGDMELAASGQRPGMVVAGGIVVNKGDLKLAEKIDRKQNVQLLVKDQSLVEDNLVRELLEDERGDLARRPTRAWRPLDPKMERRALSTMLMKKRLHNQC